MFDIALWNQYETTLADGISTNNALESWNKGWNSLMGPHPNVWSVIGGFLQQEADARRQIMSNAADLDMRENSGRRSLGEQACARIKSVIEEYEHLPMAEYLLKLSHLISNN